MAVDFRLYIMYTLDMKTQERIEAAEELKALLKSQRKGIVEVLSLSAGGFSVEVRGARNVRPVARDLARAGLKLELHNPDPNNPYCSGNHFLLARTEKTLLRLAEQERQLRAVCAAATA